MKKYGVISNNIDWQTMREIRNSLAHEYLDDINSDIELLNYLKLDGVCNPVRNVFSSWTGFATPSVTFSQAGRGLQPRPSRLDSGCWTGFATQSVTFRFWLSSWTGFATPSVTFSQAGRGLQPRP